MVFHHCDLEQGNYFLCASVSPSVPQFLLGGSSLTKKHASNPRKGKKRERKGTQSRRVREKTHRKSNRSIIILNVNGPNAPVKRQKIGRLNQKAKPNSVLLTGDTYNVRIQKGRR